jgi:hypothetical protein
MCSTNQTSLGVRMRHSNPRVSRAQTSAIRLGSKLCAETVRCMRLLLAFTSALTSASGAAAPPVTNQTVKLQRVVQTKQACRLHASRAQVIAPQQAACETCANPGISTKTTVSLHCDFGVCANCAQHFGMHHLLLVFTSARASAIAILGVAH